MTKEAASEITFKASYARGQSFIVPATLILPLVGTTLPLLIIFFALTFTGHPQNAFLYMVLGFAVLIPYLFFFHGKAWKKFGVFHNPPKVILANQTQFSPDEKLMKPIIGPRVRQNLKKQKEVIHPIEDMIHLVKMLRYRFDGLEFSAYLQENSRKEMVVVWVFECPGVSYSLSDDQYKAIAKKLDKGLADYSRSCSADTITLDAEVRAGCDEALAKTQAFRDARSLPPEDLFILDSIDSRTKDLTRDGRIAPRHLRIYCTTNLSELGFNYEEMEIADRTMAFLEQQFSFLAPLEDVQKDLRNKLTLAYEQGFKKWKRLIEMKLELSVETFSVKDAWQIAWNEVNTGIAPTHGHVITLSEEGMIVHQSDDKRLLASILFQHGQPTLGKDFVFLPGRSEYLGLCVMNKFPNRSWTTEERREQLRYGSAAINTPSALNTRILVQLSTVDQSQAQFASGWKVKTENSARDWNEKHKLKDVGSEVQMEDAVEVAKAQRKGATSIKWAWIAMVSRPTAAKLNDAIASLTEHSSFSGNIISRERGYCGDMWLGSMPSLSAHKMLQKVYKPKTRFSSFERRLENETTAVVGILPIMREQPLHKKGYQLVTRLKEPIWLDPCGKRPHLNFILLGEKGSGKSKLVQGLAKNAMIQGARTIVIDGSRTDGSGSFDEWAKFEPTAAYFNPNRDAYNIFDAIDQRYLAPFDPEDEKSIDIWGGIEGFLIQSLTELSYQGTNPELTSKFRELHSYFVGEFYRNSEIKALRDAAFDGGMGSAAWKQMPTLHHYLDFLKIENLPESVRKYVDPEILNKAGAAIYSLLQQRLGKAIARPTNVNFDDAQLIVYAMSAIQEADMLPLGIAMAGSFQAQANKPGLKQLIFEEAALNLRHKVLALIVSEAYAQGRKKNQHCLIASQGITPIIQSSAADDIMINSPVKIVGMIVPSAVDLIADACKIPVEAVQQCAQASFIPKDEEFARRFLIASKEGHLFASDYADFRSLFMVMNEADELDIKAQMKDLHPDNKYKRIDAGARILRAKSIHQEK